MSGKVKPPTYVTLMRAALARKLMLEGLSYSAIGVRLGVTQSSVGPYLKNIRHLKPKPDRSKCKKCGTLRVTGIHGIKRLRCPKCHMIWYENYKAKKRNGRPAYKPQATLEKQNEGARTALLQAGIWYAPPHKIPEAVYWQLKGWIE